MIAYSHGKWGIHVLLSFRGSVIPKALVWSVPCALVTILLHGHWGEEKGDDNLEMQGIGTIWSGFSFVLGFLIVFRSNQAYSRFWESVTLFQQIGGEWLNAFSNLLCFCSKDPEKLDQVNEFRYYLSRFMSLLHCNTLQTLCELSDDSLEVLDLGGLCKKSLWHLQKSPDRSKTVLLWISCLIMEAHQHKTIEVPGPILSRAFQELSQGMVCVTDLRKIRDVPFPFPYSQYLCCMLIAHWILAPVVASQTVLKPWWAGIMVLVVSTSYWTLFYIAQEIDQPFGEDANDLPVREMQHKFNAKLQFFLEPLSTKVPDFSMESSQHLEMLRSSYNVSQSNIASPHSVISVAAAVHMSDTLKASHSSPIERPDLQKSKSLDEVQGASLMDPLEPEMLHDVIVLMLPDVGLKRVAEMLKILGVGDEETGLDLQGCGEDFSILSQRQHKEMLGRTSLADVAVRVDDLLSADRDVQEPELQRSLASLSEALAKTIPRVKRAAFPKSAGRIPKSLSQGGIQPQGYGALLHSPRAGLEMDQQLLMVQSCVGKYCAEQSHNILAYTYCMNDIKHRGRFMPESEGSHGLKRMVSSWPDPESTGLVQNASSTAHAASTSVGADTVLAPGVAELKVQASWIQISNLSVCDTYEHHSILSILNAFPAGEASPGGTDFHGLPAEEFAHLTRSEYIKLKAQRRHVYLVRQYMCWSSRVPSIKRIQAYCWRYLAQVQMLEHRRNAQLKFALLMVRLQARIRLRLARKKAEKLKQQEEEAKLWHAALQKLQSEASVKIAAKCRSFIAGAQLSSSLKPSSVREIQRSCRVHEARVALLDTRRRFHAAREIQRMCRVHWSRLQVRDSLAVAREQERMRLRAIMRLQTLLKGMRARQELHHLRVLNDEAERNRRHLEEERVEEPELPLLLDPQPLQLGPSS
ncbi:unnamed protein product [Symbiodinium sp. KB8]|nr:unnamed protein product [Symbiodinium sp. KB8]